MCVCLCVRVYIHKYTKGRTPGAGVSRRLMRRVKKPVQSSSTTAVATSTKNHVHKNMTVFFAWYRCVYKT